MHLYLCTYICTYVRLDTHTMYAFMHLDLQVCVCSTYVCIIYLIVHLKDTYTHTQTYMHMCVSKCTWNIYVCKFIHIYTYMYVLILTQGETGSLFCICNVQRLTFEFRLW